MLEDAIPCRGTADYTEGTIRRKVLTTARLNLSF